MKRQVSLAILLCCILAFVSSCEKAPLLVLNTPSSISFTEQGGTQTVSFSANRDWTISSSDSWCRVSPSSGSNTNGDIFVTVNCDYNTTYDVRNATLTINAEGLVESIIVTQDTNVGLIISPKSYIVDSSAQLLEIEVNTNVDYNVEIDNSCQDWISIYTTKSLSTKKFVLKIGSNESYNNRVGEVVVKQVNGNLSETIIIKQNQTDTILIPQKEINVSKDEQSVIVDLETNVDYEVLTDASWIRLLSTKSLTSSSIELHIEENTNYIERVALIQIQKIGGGVSETIIITQAKSYVLSLTPSEVVISGKAQSFTVTLESNSDCTITIPDEVGVWIKTPSLHVSNGEIVFMASSNTSNSNRDIDISFSSEESGLNQILKVTQLAPKAKLSLSITAGHLKEAIDNLGIDYLNVDELTLSGGINGDDLAIIRTMSGNDKYNTPSKGSLEYLDMKGCTLIPGSEIYLNINGRNYTIQGYNEIPYNCFSNCSKLKTIILPEGCRLNSSGSQFSSCENLEEVVLPSSASIIPGNCFSGSRRLKVLNLPYVTKVEEYAFNSCSSLEKIVFDRISSFNSSAFERCDSLREVIIPSTNPSYCTYDGVVYSKDMTILYYCPAGLTGDFETPPTVEQISSFAFSSTHLSNIVFSDGLRVIGSYVFYPSHMKTLVIPDSVTSIGSIFLTDNENLTYIRLSAGISYVPSIHNCTALEEIEIPEGVQSITGSGISSYFLNNCTALRKITIPSSLVRLSGGFYNTKISEVHCKSPTPQTFDLYPFVDNAIIYVPKGSLASYQAHNSWKKYTLKEEE